MITLVGNIVNFVSYNNGIWLCKKCLYFLEMHTDVCRGEKTMPMIFFKTLKQKMVEAYTANSLIIIKSVMGIEGFIIFYLVLSILSSGGLLCYSSIVQLILFLFFLRFQET